ncbi:hypothetical protein [Geomicrobium sp. JCM 19039]|uniref:hypothetical protein n=1 Tax=Geomicrobium sp. JCM 19039 TaxID=1460636 RepID=UPI00045F306E|nr:hypothetical protein [Geomicrobium sp. JCM 19039]GAK13456.1 hypothetical protein JCM19039_3303 [Geomicrobium sp. JCM 19039]
MSIATDLAAIKIVADIEKTNDQPKILKNTVDTLVESVQYIHYAALHVSNHQP